MHIRMYISMHICVRTYVCTYICNKYVLYLRYNVLDLSLNSLSASRHTFFLSSFGYGLCIMQLNWIAHKKQITTYTHAHTQYSLLCMFT